MRARVVPALVVGLLLLSTVPARAGRLVLDNDRVIEGPIEDIGPGGVVVRYRNGRVVFPRSQVVSIEFGPGDPWIRRVSRSLRAEALDLRERAREAGALDLAPIPYVDAVHAVERGDERREERDHLLARDAYAEAGDLFRQALEDIEVFRSDRGRGIRRLVDRTSELVARAGASVPGRRTPDLEPLPWSRQGLVVPRPAGWSIRDRGDRLLLVGPAGPDDGRPSVAFAVHPAADHDAETLLDRCRESLVDESLRVGPEVRRVPVLGRPGRILAGRTVRAGRPVLVLQMVCRLGERVLLVTASTPGPRTPGARTLFERVFREIEEQGASGESPGG